MNHDPQADQRLPDPREVLDYLQSQREEIPERLFTPENLAKKAGKWATGAVLERGISGDEAEQFISHVEVLSEILPSVLHDDRLDKSKYAVPQTVRSPKFSDPESFLGAVLLAARGLGKSFKASHSPYGAGFAIEVTVMPGYQHEDLVNSYNSTRSAAEAMAVWPARAA